jgi:hypothetical protein
MSIKYIYKYKYIILQLILVIVLVLILYNNIYNIEYYQNDVPITTNSDNNSDNNSANIIYCFWTGDNKMSDARIECLTNLRKVSECNVILITKDNLKDYILNDVPLHPTFKYLSETHKADYLRTYFMNFYGGGYSDIKQTTGSWIKSFNDLKNSDYWICGYKEINGGVAYAPYANKWKELIGNGAYICKKQTPLTQEWYNNMITLLNTKLEKLKINPSTNPQDSSESGSGYPIEWNEMLGRIFHKISYKYKDHLLNTLPISIFTNYR